MRLHRPPVDQPGTNTAVMTAKNELHLSARQTLIYRPGPIRPAVSKITISEPP